MFAFTLEPPENFGLGWPSSCELEGEGGPLEHCASLIAKRYLNIFPKTLLLANQYFWN